MTELLDVRGLSVEVRRTPGDAIRLVDAVSLTVGAGEAYGLVGESGCGKSTTVRAIIRLLGAGARVAEGSIMFEGRDLARLGEREVEAVRGGGIGMVFQDPLSALNPVLPAGRQIAEGLRHHGVRGRAVRAARVRDVMRLVGLPDPDRIAAAYPQELSGGQRQRVGIAMALACAPRLLLADEPTTALDVTIQDQILALLSDLRARLAMALLLVTHDLGVVAQTCTRVAVMYAGRIVEEAPVADLFAAPVHPYTRALLASIPRGPRARHGLRPIAGLPPDPAHRPPGCAFAPRCPRQIDVCSAVIPTWTVRPRGGGGHACHNPGAGAAGHG